MIRTQKYSGMQMHSRCEKRKGFTLLEVLVSTSVIMIGVFGIAGAVALSGQLVKQSFRSDMAANCGRAALRTMITQNWLEDFEEAGAGAATYTYNWNPSFGTFKDKSGTMAINGYEARMKYEDFDCVDHLKQNNEGRNLDEYPPYYDLSLTSDYSWTGTIRKISNSDYAEVTAAVSYKRNRKDKIGLSFSASSISDDLGVVNLQVSAQGSNEDDLEYLKPGHYVYLTNGTLGHWYRIGTFYAGEMQLH
ncbi:MAG: prepilin-type N-terminal cleavage/methylation domain-containing protein, partial [Planctomycetia bacterium]|nr:prepilin-type N-terminal cleavage/methylation domain-containing protein [Planctomycetia bacterium]